MFVRAANLIESKLEASARELKMDKYIGDADWNIVWR